MASDRHPSPDEPAPGDAGPGIIVVVADNADMRGVLADALRMEDFIAVPAVDVEQAIAVAQRLALSLVVVVVEQDPEAVQQFKDSGSTAPMLALCFESEAHAPAQCRIRSADALLCWPFTLGEAVAAVHRFVVPGRPPLQRRRRSRRRRNDRCGIP